MLRRPGLRARSGAGKSRPVPEDLPLVRRICAALIAGSLALACAAHHGAGTAPGGLSVLAPAWHADLDAGGPMQIVPAHGGFCVVMASGRVFFLDGLAGKILWQRDLGAPVTGPSRKGPLAGTDKGQWLAIPGEAKVTLLTLPGGEPLAPWARPAGSGDLRLSEVGGRLLALTGAGGATLVEPRTGSALWSVKLPSPASAPGALCRGQILLGVESGDLIGVDPEDGKVRWRKRLHSPPAVEPECAGRHMYVATRDNAVHALRLHRRSAGRMWKVLTGADPDASPVALDDLLLVFSKDTYLYGFHRRNGHLVFRVRLNRRPGPGAVIDGLVLVSGLQSTRLDAFRLPTGIASGGFDLPVGSRFVTPPVLSGGYVALGVARFGETDRSQVIALTPAPAPPPAAPPG